MAIKSFEEIQARDLIAGAEQDSQAFKLEQSFGRLDRMSLDDLVERLDQVESQATLIKWRIWWAIRQKFPSDKLFGQYVAELRNSPHANIVGSQQEINRMLNAGRFCEAHRINDLHSIGILQSGLYELSRPVNDDIASRIFKEVKKKGYPLAEIQRRISQARAVLTVDRQPEPMPYDEPESPPVEPREPYTVEVVKGVAQVGELLEPEVEPEIAEAVERQEAVAVMRENIEANTEEEIINAILSFVAWYKLSPMKLIAILQGVIKRVQAETYRSQA